MVTLSCANNKINIFKSKFKTSFEENEQAINNDLWCRIVPIVKEPPHQSSAKPDSSENDLAGSGEANATITRHDLKEFTWAVIKNFVEKNSVKIIKLIDLNLEMCVMEKNDHYRVVEVLFSWEILFLNIELNLFFTNEYLRAILSTPPEASKSDEKNLLLSTEMLDFIRLHAIKKDLLTKRECIYNQKISLMAFRTSLALHLESKSADEIKLNETQILKYVFEIGQAVENLDNAEQDLDFELNLLKQINEENFRSLRELFKDETSQTSRTDWSTKNIAVDLNSQSFFKTIKSYHFKTKFRTFFENFLIKKENELLRHINERLKSKLKDKE